LDLSELLVSIRLGADVWMVCSRKFAVGRADFIIRGCTGNAEYFVWISLKGHGNGRISQRGSAVGSGNLYGMKSTPAVVLVSGGLDSATVLALAARDHPSMIALTFEYGQRHSHELSCAASICRNQGVSDHRVIPLDASLLAGSALTGGGEIPRPESIEVIGSTIPDTYVPARNTVFLSMALAVAEIAGAADIYIGANAIDFSGYPDCRPEFISAFQTMARLATKCGVEGVPLSIMTPLINMTKAEIIQCGIDMGVDYSMTSSCYDPSDSGQPCGSCESCLLRAEGFAEAGVVDPLVGASV
jgi:7-cyano-7-deazaguanine synthase